MTVDVDIQIESVNVTDQQRKSSPGSSNGLYPHAGGRQQWWKEMLTMRRQENRETI